MKKVISKLDANFCEVLNFANLSGDLFVYFHYQTSLIDFFLSLTFLLIIWRNVRARFIKYFSTVC